MSGRRRRGKRTRFRGRLTEGGTAPAERTTFSAFTSVACREVAEALGEAMDRLTPRPQGVGIVELEDGSGLWEVSGYFADRPEGIGLSLMEAGFGASPCVVSELPETDWVAKVRRELPPVEAGRFHVHGGHDADTVPEGRVALLVEAATAFGTGHHGTTLGCLLALDRLVHEGTTPKSVLDLGCGTAVLAMAAAFVWPVSPLASDIDGVAVEVARTNVRVNGLEGRIHCVQATGLDHPRLLAGAPYDLVFANILKSPLIELAPSISEASTAMAHVILSGILDGQVPEVRAAYEPFGFDEIHGISIAGWATLTLRRVRSGQTVGKDGR